MNSNELSRPKSPRTRTMIVYGAGGTAAAAAVVAMAAVLVAVAAVAMRAAARAMVAARSVGATAVAVHGGGEVAVVMVARWWRR